MNAGKKKRSISWVAEMERLFEEGRLAEAAAVYDEQSNQQLAPIESSLLRGRLYLRTDPPRALSFLNSLRAKKTTPEFVKREMLLGEAYALSEDYEAAEDRLNSALTGARALNDADLIAAVGWRIARRFVFSNQADRAREAWDLARLGPSFASKLNALHLESYILSREGRFRDQARVLLELLRQISPDSTTHMEHRAWATHTLAILAREIYIPEAVAEVERQLRGTPWPPDFLVNRFQTTKAIGWAKALQGDYLNAFRYLKQSAANAPDAAWGTMAFCDRAYLAHAIGEERWSRQELLDAEESAENANWEQSEDEEAIALLLLAELFAPIDAPKASQYLAQFRHVGEIRKSRLLLRKDERFDALANYYTGVVDAALGHRKLAMSRLQASLEVYERIGYDWRAARCALRLFDETNKAQYLKIAEERLRNYSSSWLASELRSHRTPSARSSSLSPMQNRIFRHLCEGLSNAQIASLLGRSESTVANHAKAVLKQFGVSSRSALIAEAMRRGLL